MLWTCLIIIVPENERVRQRDKLSCDSEQAAEEQHTRYLGHHRVPAKKLS